MVNDKKSRADDLIEEVLDALRGSEAFEQRCLQVAEAAWALRALRGALRPSDVKPEPLPSLVQRLGEAIGIEPARTLALLDLKEPYDPDRAESVARTAHALGLTYRQSFVCFALGLPEGKTEPIFAMTRADIPCVNGDVWDHAEAALAGINWSTDSKRVLERFVSGLRREYERDQD